MTRRLLIAAGLAAAAFAQPQMPKPAPELARLNYFVGNWKSDGEMKPGPFGPGGKITGTDRFEWYPGKFFLVMHGEGKSPMGEEKAMGFFGYDAETKKYTFEEISSTGEHVSSRGTVEGKTWHWYSEEKYEGKPMKSHVTIQEVSPTEYTFGYEYSTDGGKTWTKMMESRSKKTSKGTT